ncbi:hypothetical protein PCE1_004634 [Barthelona sp. PCE]
MKFAVFTFNGIEPCEMISAVDILRRAKVDVDMISLTNAIMINGAHGFTFRADITWEDFNGNDYDAFVVPGGPGTFSVVAEHEILHEELKRAKERGVWICAVCAAPMILARCGLLDNLSCTSWPGVEDEIISAADNVTYKTDNVVVEIEAKIITSRALGTSVEWALEMVRHIVSAEVSDNIRDSVCFTY